MTNLLPDAGTDDPRLRREFDRLRARDKGYPGAAFMKCCRQVYGGCAGTYDAHVGVAESLHVMMGAAMRHILIPEL